MNPEKDVNICTSHGCGFISQESQATNYNFGSCINCCVCVQLCFSALLLRLRDYHFACVVCVGGSCGMANWMVGENAFVMEARNS